MLYCLHESSKYRVGILVVIHMKNKWFIQISLLIYIMICGCAYITKEININPIESKEWAPLYNSSAKYPRLYYDCKSFHVKAKFITVESTMYSVGPILPIIPFYQKNAHTSDNDNLKLEIVLSVDMSDVDKFKRSYYDASLSEQSLFIEINQGLKILNPISYDVNGTPRKSEYYHFSFNVDPKSISDFKLVFKDAVGDCMIPPLVFKREDLGLEYNVLTNYNQMDVNECRTSSPPSLSLLQ